MNRSVWTFGIYLSRSIAWQVQLYYKAASKEAPEESWWMDDLGNDALPSKYSVRFYCSLIALSPAGHYLLLKHQPEIRGIGEVDRRMAAGGESQ